jgi:hypothetical protein
MIISKRLLLHTALPLLVGFIIYLFFHKANLLLHHYAYKYFGFINYYENIKKYKSVIFIVNHLPDILWVYSLGIFLIHFIKLNNNKNFKAAIILIIGSLSEIIQLFFPQQFTFDWLDLLFTLIILILILYKYEVKKSI